MRFLGLVYGFVCYAIFFCTFLYCIGFVGNLYVPRSIDVGPESNPLMGILTNLGLIVAFGLQHSTMARPWFKQRVHQLIPTAFERSTYVLASSIAFIALFWVWKPLRPTIWEFNATAIEAVFFSTFCFGWLLILMSTCLLNHFDLFGLRQVWLKFKGQPYTPLEFSAPSIYSYMRHPLYVGWMVAIWATPVMTLGHLIFAAGLTAYILIAIRYEEADLVQFHGSDYIDYQRAVPMFGFRLFKQKSAE